MNFFAEKPLIYPLPDQAEIIEFKSKDELLMKAFYLKSAIENTKGTLIMIHGIRSRKERFSKIGGRLAEMGYNVVAVDLRAHGESGGIHCTFGEYEKRDLQALIDILEEKGLAEHIGIWGQSLGAAVALQTMEIDKRIQFGIIESTFSNLESIVHDYTKFFIGFNPPFLTNYLLSRSAKIANYHPESIQPSESCKNIHQPVFYAHGEIDEKISIDYGRKNFNALASQEKQFHIVENAKHSDVWQVGGKDYYKKVFDFLDSQAIQTE